MKHSDSSRDMARRDTVELVDRLLREVMFERRFGRLEVVFQDGIVDRVVESKIYKIGPPPTDRAAA